MKFKFSTIIPIVLITAVVFITGCEQEVIYPIIPAIQFKDYEKLESYSGRDSALKLTITFTDGDGDLGLSQIQVKPPFDSTSIYYYNMYVYYYEFFDNKWNQVTVNDFSTDTIRFKYRFPNLTPNADNKSIKGDIEYTITNLLPRKSNTIKFVIYIYDRKLHKSNIVESDIIYYSP
jgi:hypothetical protein